ncbi:MAG TPA: PEP-CTERM sorting domain-containing protein [Steroidobacteraceae bacterium]|nr:PEP-CTERM sorting domain-containing protein [Steroidobacteraceae bacterium]
MKRLLLRAAAAALTLSSVDVARAVPVYLDFTGTIASYTLPAVEGAETGTAIAGSFTLETDRLLSSGPPLSGVQYTFVDFNPTGLAQPLATVNFGGREISFPQFERTYAYVTFVDGCQPVCNAGSSESYSINAATEDVFTPGYTGRYHSYFLNIFASARTPLPDYPYFEYFDAFDGAAMTPADAFTLPTWNLQGNFLENVFDCVDGSCTSVASNASFNFDITSLTRGVGARPVPEPGMLGLFVAALGGAWLMRRRPPAATRHAR